MLDFALNKMNWGPFWKMCMFCYEKKFENNLRYLFCITHEILFKNNVFSVMTGVNMSLFLIFYFWTLKMRANMKFVHKLCGDMILFCSEKFCSVHCLEKTWFLKTFGMTLWFWIWFCFCSVQLRPCHGW